MTLSTSLTSPHKTAIVETIEHIYKAKGYGENYQHMHKNISNLNIQKNLSSCLAFVCVGLEYLVILFSH